MPTMRVIPHRVAVWRSMSASSNDSNRSIHPSPQNYRPNHPAMGPRPRAQPRRLPTNSASHLHQLPSWSAASLSCCLCSLPLVSSSRASAVMAASFQLQLLLLLLDLFLLLLLLLFWLSALSLPRSYSSAQPQPQRPARCCSHSQAAAAAAAIWHSGCGQPFLWLVQLLL